MNILPWNWYHSKMPVSWLLQPATALVEIWHSKSLPREWSISWRLVESFHITLQFTAQRLEWYMFIPRMLRRNYARFKNSISMDVYDYSTSSALTIELLQSCSKPAICVLFCGSFMVSRPLVRMLIPALNVSHPVFLFQMHKIFWM